MTAAVTDATVRAAAAAHRRALIEQFTGPVVAEAVRRIGPAGRDILTPMSLLPPERTEPLLPA